ncbi:unnamed protein product [Lymnaea stagnalis]|uniref:Phosphatidylinositol glycan anchor biosynthesis class U protein n=1 Tax=Lymnaea stagnalis TaxID=6523 RepID=A0AAV2HMQ5_LYMST
MAVLGAYFLGTFGIFLRIVLMKTNFPKWLQSRNEVVTPVTSWERVEEGFSLQKQFISPYSGDMFHETPLALRCLKLAYYFPFDGVKTFFIVIDILTMIFLYRIASAFGDQMLKEQAAEKSEYSPKAESLLVTAKQLSMLPSTLIAVHVFNPFSIMTTLAMTTSSVSNLMTLLTFYYLIKGNKLMCTLFLALSTYQTLYPLVLIVPVALHFYRNSISSTSAQSFVSGEAVSSYIITSSMFLILFGFLIGVSYVLEGSWDFLFSTYGFILTVPDLTPNTGIFWYFFTEMFDHFRTFFVCVFQMNAFIYTIPLAVKFTKRPLFLMYVLMFLTSIFKSYPSYGDAALYISLLPLWKHTFCYLRNTLMIVGMFMCCIVLSPILYHLWIFAGSANANFYFAITLTYSTAQILLFTDLLFAYIRWEYGLYNGKDIRNPDGSKTLIILE